MILNDYFDTFQDVGKTYRGMEGVSSIGNTKLSMTP